MMKIAIVTDWLYGGGGEKVVEQIHKLYPEAPIYASYCSSEWNERLGNKVVTGYLQWPPFKRLRKFLPLLRQWWYARLNLNGYDVVITVTGNGEAKFVKVKKPAIHISYCHTPTHFYWRHYTEYVKNPGFKPKWLARIGLKLLVGPLRKRDFEAAQKVDYFIANSTHIQKDIKKYYQRNAVVIHPPIATKRFKSAKQTEKRKGFVTVGRQVPYKKTELIVEACKQLKLPLTVIGNGPEHSKLVESTGPTIHFKTEISDDELPQEVANAKGFIFASLEDFGVAPVEALAAGTPVIAYKAGGAIDYIVPGRTGEFFEEQSVESIVVALDSFMKNSYSSAAIMKYAVRFSTLHFRTKLRDFVTDKTSG
jgi:glycosyltransferase involved in cell wall biosynthesis